MEDPRTLPDGQCITVEDLRVFLGLEKDWVIRDGVRHGELPHLRVGRHIRFLPEHVTAIVKRFERVPEQRVSSRRRRDRLDGEAPPVPEVPGLSRRSAKAHAR